MFGSKEVDLAKRGLLSRSRARGKTLNLESGLRYNPTEAYYGVSPERVLGERRLEPDMS
jgi:hypothetical protein